MRALALMPLLLATGCSMAPADTRPPLPVPLALPSGDVYAAETAALPAIGYRDMFRDRRLQTLIERALTNNRDLRVAAANVAAARAQYQIQRADQLPQVDMSGDVTRSRTQASTAGGANSRTRYAAQLGISAFELDLFGRLASLSRAEQNRFFATEAAARTTRLAMAGDIADTWLSHAADASLLKIAQDTAASAERSVGLTRARLQGGVVPRTDLRQAEQVLETALADVARQRTALAQDVNALQLLVGAQIDPALLPTDIADVGASVADLPAGVDSSVLLHRPDIVEAEYNLRAANAEIGAARAALFPRISLTGLLGFASGALSGLFTNGAFNYSGAAGIGYPIFSGNAARANVRSAQAQRDAAVASYEKAIQTAFRDISDSLARRGTIGEQLQAVRRQADASADNYALADARYRGGVDGFLTSLVAQRSLYQAQQTLVAIQLEAASNRVAIFRSLGGDATWE
jgi:multidrug efflux system outer membrane protein